MKTEDFTMYPIAFLNLGVKYTCKNSPVPMPLEEKVAAKLEKLPFAKLPILICLEAEEEIGGEEEYLPILTKTVRLFGKTYSASSYLYLLTLAGYTQVKICMEKA